MRPCLSFLAAAAPAVCLATSVLAQTPYPAETNLRFEVWDGTQWTGTVNANPGDRIEWRAVISYVGTRTDVLGLAECLYQPIIPNADNAGPIRDQLGLWRNSGHSGDSVPGSMLSVAEGNDGGPLASYGRVGFGNTGSTEQHYNTMTSFRHVNGSQGAPPGSWLRVAGSFVSQWPGDGTGPWTANDSNRVLRGISANQDSQVLMWNGQANPHWRGGTQDLVILRQALIVGDDAADRTIEITTDERFLRRAGMEAGTDDNRRFVSWYTHPSQWWSQSYRTSLTITPAIALVTIPAPGAGVLALLACALMHRRTRST